MRLLVIEDEARLAGVLKDLLERQGYQVDICGDGDTGLRLAISGGYDGILLDVMLPKRDGFSVVAELRRGGSTVPVLILTAKSELEDRVTGLDNGADYYLTKPFAQEELLACVRALLRRQGDVPSNQLSFGDLTLELDTLQLCRGSRSVSLSRKEFELLRLLINNRGSLISKEALLTQVWGLDRESGGENYVEVYLSFLRKKLSHIQSRVEITAVRGMGYRLRKPEE